MVDWKLLFANRATGFDLSVHNVRVGDSVDAIPFDRITTLEPRTPSVRRSSGTRGVFDVDDDGRETPVSRETLIAELRQHGGRAFLDSVTYEVTEGRIRKIWVRGSPLKGLPIKVEADIERLLGPSIGIERKYGWHSRHFPERGLTVSWHVENNCIEYVALGPVEWTPPTFGAEQVLSEWLAASRSGLAPHWKAPADRKTSAWVRYTRVMSLLRAFDLGAPKTFEEGKFLEGRSLADYPKAAEALQSKWVRMGRDVWNYRDALGRLFWWLLVYRTDAERLLRLNSGWLEAGHPGILTALRVTESANQGVATALAEVDALLIEMISPKGKRITEQEMVSRWGWPEVDLDALLMDEL